MVGVVRALMTESKSKIGVVSGVICSTESESQESERCHFLSTPLMTQSLLYGPVKTGLSESEAEAKEPTNHNAWNQAL